MKKSILCFFTLVTFAQLSAQTTTHYGFDSQADLDNNFTYTCENTNGSMTIPEAYDKVKPTGKCLEAKMGGTGKKSNFLISKNSFNGISQIEFYLASSDKGKTSFAIEASSDPTFASNVTSILPLAIFSDIEGIPAKPSNNTLYKVTIPITNIVSGYLRFTFNQPSSSGKFMWLDELTITSKPSSILVKYDPAGGTCDRTSDTYTGKALTLPTPDRGGYDFLGWSDGTKIYGALLY